jgi:hypothetical protein
LCLPESWSPLRFLNHICNHLCQNEVPNSYCWWHTVMHTPESWTQNNKSMILIFSVDCMYILTLIMAQNVSLDHNFGFYPDFYPKILPWLWPLFLFLILTRLWTWFLTLNY